LKSIKEITDSVIDLVHENTWVEEDVWIDDDGSERSDPVLSPKPELYSKLNQYFAEMYASILVDVLKNHYGKKAVK